MNSSRASSRVQSVAKALDIIELLATERRAMALYEMAKSLGMPKSTLHDILSTLQGYGYVEQAPFTAEYSLGVRVFEIGSIVANGWDVRVKAAPYIQRLVNEVQETVHLGVLDKGEVLYIDKRESPQSLRIVSQIGTRLPAHCTGLGKAQLAFIPPEELKKIVETKGLVSYTRNTITTIERLEEEMDRIRQQGYAVDDGEIMENLKCFAAPIRDHSGKVVAAVSVSGPTDRMSKDDYINRIVTTAMEISGQLGYRPEGAQFWT